MRSSSLLTLPFPWPPSKQDLLPAYKKKPKKLTPDESLKRTIGTIPRAAVNEMLFQSIKDSKRITPADFDTTLRNVVDSGILQLPVEVGREARVKGSLIVICFSSFVAAAIGLSDPHRNRRLAACA